MEWHWLSFQQLTTVQLYAVMQLRQQVFVVEQNCIYQDVDGLDIFAWHGMGYLPDGKLVAYARILPPGTAFAHPSIGRVVIAPALRGQQGGIALMEQAMRRAADLFPNEAIQIGAQAHLQQFYARFGFVPISDPYEEDGITHIHMLASSSVNTFSMPTHGASE